MAATELAFTLEALQTGADPSFSVTVQSGTDRMFVVAIGLPYSYTVINGVTLNGTSLTAVTDGTTTAQGNDTDFGHGVKFWRLLDASFPAAGSRTLAVDTAGAGTEGYWIAHWQMSGVDQSTNVVDVVVTSHTSTDPLSTTGLAATAADQECFAICCSTNPASGTTLTIDGTNTTQVTVDNDVPSAFPHYWKAGHKTVQSGTRTVTVDATGAQGSNLIVAFIVGTTASAIDVSGSATFPQMTAAGVVYEPNVSGAATFPALTAAGVVYEPNVSGAVSFPALTASGTIDETTVQGAVSFPALTAAGVVYQPDISGAVNFPALVASGTVEETTVSGAVSFPALAAAGVVYEPNVSGAVSFPALAAAGSVDELVVASGAASFPALVASGLVYDPVISGAVTFAVLIASGLVERVGEVRPPLAVSSPHASVSASVAQGSAAASRAKGRVN